MLDLFSEKVRRNPFPMSNESKEKCKQLTAIAAELALPVMKSLINWSNLPVTRMRKARKNVVKGVRHLYSAPLFSCWLKACVTFIQLLYSAAG
jgi:hypothetical protein